MMDADMSVITEMIARGSEHFVARATESLNLRVILQPTSAAIFAPTSGVNNPWSGCPAYLLAALTNPVHRWQLLHGGWKDMRTPFLVAATLDAIYQIIIHKFIYPLELLFTATLLALVPYFILRGPVNRIARRFISEGTGAADKGAGR